MRKIKLLGKISEIGFVGGGVQVFIITQPVFVAEDNAAT
jgi:hypothetical protein